MPAFNATQSSCDEAHNTWLAHTNSTSRQYHSIAPRGIEEFGCGSLVDENSRLGRDPGDPKSTDPDAMIRQPYTQKKPSGGYLLIQLEPATAQKPAAVTFHFEDDLGTTMYESRKMAR